MPSRRIALLAVTILAAAISLHAAPNPPVPAPQPGTSTRELVSAASKYVAKYQQEFAFLIADEAYSQTRTDAAGKSEHRQLRSEVFLTYLPADNEWVAVRDVIDVDGTPVANREELRTLLAKGGEIKGLISKVIARNARYNIGSTTRNFNEPTLPLLLVGEKRVNDVKFDRKTIERDGTAVVATLEFEERGRPTLIRGPEGSLPAKGEIALEPVTGIVRRTTFELEQPGVKVRLTTSYARDPKLGLWLPDVFNERYESENPITELVLCEAKYTNYRRFEVVGRIK